MSLFCKKLEASGKKTEAEKRRAELAKLDLALKKASEEDDLTELSPAYAITIHESQGSEFPVVIIPVVGQHFNMLFRNLIYTGLTRGKKLVIFVGSRKALALAIQTIDQKVRQTGLQYLLQANEVLKYKNETNF